MTPTLITLVIDEPRILANGTKTMRIVGYDTSGHERAWFGLDESDHELAPTAEHPDASFFGWPADYEWAVGLYDNVGESVACPSWDDATAAALYEHALRVSEGWYQVNTLCKEGSAI